MTLSIDRLYAYIAVDDEGEGIISQFVPGFGWTPMIGADQARMEALRPAAQAMANERNAKVIYAQFEVRTDVEILEPEGGTVALTLDTATAVKLAQVADAIDKRGD